MGNRDEANKQQFCLTIMLQEPYRSGCAQVRANRACWCFAALICCIVLYCKLEKKIYEGPSPLAYIFFTVVRSPCHAALCSPLLVSLLLIVASACR